MSQKEPVPMSKKAQKEPVPMCQKGEKNDTKNNITNFNFNRNNIYI